MAPQAQEHQLSCTRSTAQPGRQPCMQARKEQADAAQHLFTQWKIIKLHSGHRDMPADATLPDSWTSHFLQHIPIEEDHLCMQARKEQADAPQHLCTQWETIKLHSGHRMTCQLMQLLPDSWTSHFLQHIPIEKDHLCMQARKEHADAAPHLCKQWETIKLHSGHRMTCQLIQLLPDS